MSPIPTSEEKRRQLELALLARRRARFQPALTPRIALGERALLSPTQQRLWLHETTEGAAGLYNMPCALRLRGALDGEALRRAIELHIHRHAVLRTCIVEAEGQIWQVAQPPQRFLLPLLTPADEGQAQRWLREEADRPFDLRRGPLLRGHVLRLGEHEHILSLTMHHIVSDGWSLGIMMREIVQAYRAFCRDQPSPLDALPVQYADYSVWQREWLGEERARQQLAFWAAELEGAPALLPLPLEKPRPARQLHKGGTHRFLLSQSQIDRVRGFCREQTVTPYMLFLAIFNVLLARYCASHDIVVGSPVANRFPQETEALVGFFVNTLAMRNRPEPWLPFAGFLQQVKKQALAAFAHQDIPFDFIVERLKPERSLSHTPVFQVEFVLQPAMQRAFSMGLVDVEVMARDSSHTKFDLTFSLEDADKGMHGLIEFNAQLFTPAFAQRMAEHYQVLLNGALADPQQPVGALPLLSEAEAAALRQWAGGGEKPLGAGVLECLARWVARQPEAIAVQHGGERLSYRELDGHANRLAHALRTAGVAAGDRVALYLERGIDYLVAMLAVFKLGAAFVPFDPKQGQARHARMLARVMPAAALTAPAHAAALTGIMDTAKIVVLHREELATLPTSWTEPPANAPEAIAYLIFTSGSTGEPKAAVVTHRGMVNHLWAKAESLNLSRDDAVAQIAVQTFDVSIWQFLAALLVGGRAVVLTGADAWEPEALLDALRLKDVAVVETVPSHLEILLDAVRRKPDRHRLPQLRWMISNGEPLTSDLTARWFQTLPAIGLMNAYGPTECSDDVTHLCLRGKPEQEAPYMPIGKPIANARVYVLDQAMRPVPVGVTGELYIGGLCVGQGYFNDPTRTAESFVEDPFSSVPGARLYKSGDLGRYRGDGMLELLGRQDFQLKIRGFRIEAGEVEATLRQHPAIEQCLIMGSPDRSGQLQLAAYVISPQRPAPSAAALKAFCRQRLPDYMVPAGVCLLDEFPLLANGKIDRAALPPLLSFEAAAAEDYLPARNDVEAAVAEIWAHVLGLPRVGVNDNFFQLGGHSLLAVELVERCRGILGEQVTLAMLFEYPTIAELTLAAPAFAVEPL